MLSMGRFGMHCGDVNKMKKGVLSLLRPSEHQPLDWPTTLDGFVRRIPTRNKRREIEKEKNEL